MKKTPLEAREGSFCYNCGKVLVAILSGVLIVGVLRRRRKRNSQERVSSVERKDWKEIMKKEFFSFIELGSKRESSPLLVLG